MQVLVWREYTVGEAADGRDAAGRVSCFFAFIGRGYSRSGLENARCRATKNEGRRWMGRSENQNSVLSVAYECACGGGGGQD